MYHTATFFADYFNSRSHEGTDMEDVVFQEIFCISTHGPTRGPTLSRNHFFVDSFYISTHGPTRGPTKTQQICESLRSISTHGPTRGPTFDSYVNRVLPSISTHGPTRGPTGSLFFFLFNFRKFQLTVPRGDRPQFQINLFYMKLTFLSLLHKLISLLIYNSKFLYTFIGISSFF